MSRPEDIAVRVEQAIPGASAWGNALPIMHEIRHGLERLAETGEPSLIDLHAIPFGPGDEERLLDLLGRGEVEARLEALGTTRIWESAVPAVWLVDHANADGERIALHIEISRIPGILCAQAEDIETAASLLEARLKAIEGDAH
jgi:hydrogenase-1 operon protein HyaF